ncbi:MAG: LysE family translocator [Methanoregulaceae archaeon]|nr:LysE family translocator [Methanoregulaceae archaeon]
MLPGSPPEVFALAFVIGLTGALAPGPVLVATIDAGLTHGWTAGPRIGLGHILIESVIFLLILGGIGAGAASYSGIIGAAGGAALIAFGFMTIRGALRTDKKIVSRAIHEPVLAGMITSAANPYFWIWWGSVGSAFLIAGITGGLSMAVLFMVGHWSADVGWLTVVSVGVHRGRTILSDRMYRYVLLACGVFLVAFGGYFLIDAAGFFKAG